MSSFASLHSGLIARKGEAAPANRHSAFSYVDDVRREPQRSTPQVKTPERAEEPEEEIYHIEQRPSLFDRPAEPRLPLREAVPVFAEPASETEDDLIFVAAEPEPVSAPLRAEPQPPVAMPMAKAEAPAQPKPAPVHKHDDAEEHSGPYRLTFRMSADQRRRLRIAAAKQETSLQQVLADALDNHLDGLCACSLSECACLAREAAE